MQMLFFSPKYLSWLVGNGIVEPPGMESSCVLTQLPVGSVTPPANPSQSMCSLQCFHTQSLLLVHKMVFRLALTLTIGKY